MKLAAMFVCYPLEPCEHSHYVNKLQEPNVLQRGANEFHYIITYSIPLVCFKRQLVTLDLQHQLQPVHCLTNEAV